jgi:hypothetical protein
VNSTRPSKTGLIALIGGLLFANSGFWITSAVAAPPVKEDSLAGVTQNWDKNLPSASRFSVLPSFNNQAVRDNNTGLVWEQTIDLTNRVWPQALAICANKTVGGTGGWRLPSVVELKSVLDTSLSAPYINGVFTSSGIIAFNNWWSATTSTVNSGDAWIVDINDGRANGNSKSSGQGLAWCVRGPMNADAY